MTSLDDRLRAYLEQRARDLPSADLDRERPVSTVPSRGPHRPVRRVMALAAGVLAIAGVVTAAALFVVSDDEDDPGGVRAGPVTTEDAARPTSMPDPDAPFTWPDSCLPPAQGSDRVVSPDLLPAGVVPSWTTSNPGEWLRTQLVAGGVSEPYSAGSAWVVMHGVDGVVLAWLGPPGDTASLPLREIGGVDSAEVAPEVPFERGAYRPAVVDSVRAGGVRLWFLTHPRDRWESINFPGLTTAPCLPEQSAIRRVLLQVAAAAEQQPYRGTLPESAGHLRINTDRGISITDPGDQHLIEVGGRALGRSLTAPGLSGPTLNGNDVFIYTTIPPYDTDSVGLLFPQQNPPGVGHVAAGGLDLLLYIQAAGNPQPDQGITEDVQRIAAALNRDPFLGQPVP